MKFKDVLVNRAERLSVGREETTGKPYLSIPVSNGLVDYEEYFELSSNEFELFQVDLELASSFAQKCRRHELDERLIIRPGTNRGVAV